MPNVFSILYVIVPSFFFFSELRSITGKVHFRIWKRIALFHETLREREKTHQVSLSLRMMLMIIVMMTESVLMKRMTVAMIELDEEGRRRFTEPWLPSISSSPFTFLHSTLGLPLSSLHLPLSTSAPSFLHCECALQWDCSVHSAQCTVYNVHPIPRYFPFSTFLHSVPLSTPLPIYLSPPHIPLSSPLPPFLQYNCAFQCCIALLCAALRLQSVYKRCTMPSTACQHSNALQHSAV